MTKKSIKKISIILGIVLIVLWFGGNLGLYLYIKYIYTYDIGAFEIISRNDMEKAFNYIPEKLKLSEEAALDAESLHLFQYKLKFPFYREDIINILLSFEREEYDLQMFHINIKADDLSVVSFAALTTPKQSEVSLWNWIFDTYYENYSSFELQKAAYYSRLKDYSWWNLPYNIKLSHLLILKASTISLYERVYDLETPYIKGFLVMMKVSGSEKSAISLLFEINGKTYAITFFNPKDEKKVRNIIATIQPIDNIEKSYKEMEALYRDKESRYPEEVSLISMISLKGPTIEDLKELLKVMEEKNYHATTIENVKKEIEYLQKQ